MAKWLIICPVERASGSQFFKVSAETPEEALALHKAGKSNFDSEEVEITALGNPEVVPDEPPVLGLAWEG